MTLLKKAGGEHIIYEHQELGVLVAIAKENTSVIKKYWKKYKGKKNIPSETVQGNPFVYNEEQESLVIDFTTEQAYVIDLLKKTE
jgi:hypothetical protein